MAASACAHAPALASLDDGGRVLHIGSFSKTINPALRLGFMVVPPALAPPLVSCISQLSLRPMRQAKSMAWSGPRVKLETASPSTSARPRGRW